MRDKLMGRKGRGGFVISREVAGVRYIFCSGRNARARGEQRAREKRLWLKELA